MTIRHGPVMLVMSRQKLPVLDRDRYGAAEGVHQGAYILAEAPGGTPRLLLIASGSEIHVALRLGRSSSPRGWRYGW